MNLNGKKLSGDQRDRFSTNVPTHISKCHVLSLSFPFHLNYNRMTKEQLRKYIVGLD